MTTAPQSSPLKIYFYHHGHDGFIFPIESPLLPMFDPASPEYRTTPYFQPVSSPTEADFLILPYDLGNFVNAVGIPNVVQYLRRLPFFADRAAAHVFFVRHDDSRPLGLPAVIFRIGANTGHRDARTVALPYRSEDFGALAAMDFSALTYDTGFVGYVGLIALRQKMADSVLAEPSLAAMIKLRPAFFMHISQLQNVEKQQVYRAEYLYTLEQSRTILCPRGEGEGSIRFFEAMSAGRVPVVLADEHDLPFSDQIDYGAFILRIPQADAAHTGAKLSSWLANHPPAKLQRMGQLARQAWVAYLAADNLPKQVYRHLARAKTNAVAITVAAPRKMRPAANLMEYVYARAHELPRHSNVVAIYGDDHLPALTLAHGLAAAHNTDSQLTAIPLPESHPHTKPAIAGQSIAWLPEYSPGVHGNFHIRSVHLLYFSGFTSAEDTRTLLEQWYRTLGFGGIVIGVDRTPDRRVARTAAEFAAQSGWFTLKTALQTPTHTLFELEFNAAADFKKRFHFDAPPAVPLTDTAPVLWQVSFAGDSSPHPIPPVSLCMIVKNEEDNLADCLRSVGDFAAEIIVVDTGSTDRTVEIAESFGAKVYHFDWIDDFAAARNESLRHAGGEWIFWLDADDRISPQNLRRLKQAVASGRADAFRCRMVSPLGGDTSAVNIALYTLLFRNGRGVKFEGAIHETPTDAAIRRRLTLANTNISIEHRGYFGDSTQLRRKAERNARILRRCISAEPDNLKWRYHLGVSLYQMEDYAGVVAQFEPIVAHPVPPLNEGNQVYRVHLLLVSAYASTGDTIRAEALLQRALERYPTRRHLWVATGKFYLHQNRPDAAIVALEHARTLPEHTLEGEDWQRGALENELARAHHLVAVNAFQRQDFLAAAESLQQEVRAASQPAQVSEAWKLMAVCLQKLGQESEAVAAWKVAKEIGGVGR